MPVSPQSAIEQLRERFPHYKDLSDEHVYRIARRDYPDAPIQDWPESGYVAPKQSSPDDIYLDKTDEDTFLDYFNWGIDEDSSYLARLAYTRSLQGMASDFLRGEAKFKLERQPAIWEEAVAGILAYAQPLDLLSLYGGGSIVGKAFVKSSLGKGATDYLTKGIIKMSPKAKYSEVSRAVAGILGSEMAYVPYEGAKANMFARTLHMQNPGMDPLTPEEIQKETFAGVVHGGVMGVLGGSARPFLAAKHAGVLRQIDKLELKKALTSGQQKQLFSLKNKVKYTGNLGQYASEVAGLTAGDVAGTAVAYGQMKSMEELAVTVATMGGFAGVTRLTSYGLNRIVDEPLTKAYEKYEIEHQKRQKELDAEDNVIRDMHEKAKSQDDSAIESRAMDDVESDSAPSSNKPRIAWEDTPEYKEYQQLIKDKESFMSMRDKLRDEDALDFLKEKYNIALRIANFIDNSGYNKAKDGVNGIHEWLRDGARKIENSLEQKKGDMPSQIQNLQFKLKQEFDIETIKVDDGTGNLIDVDISEAQKYMPGDTPIEKQTNLLNKAQELYNNVEQSQTKRISKKYEQNEREVISLSKDKNEIQKSIDDLKGRLNEDMPEKRRNELATELSEHENSLAFLNEIDEEINKINKSNSLTTNSKNKYTLNFDLLKTFISTQYADLPVRPATKKSRAKALISFIKKVNKETDSKLTALNENRLVKLAREMFKSDASALTDFLKFLDKKGALPRELQGIGDDIFKVSKKQGGRTTPRGLLTSDVKGGGGLDIVTSKTGTRKNIDWSDTKSKHSNLDTKSLLKKVIKLVQDKSNKVIAYMNNKKVEYESIFFIKKQEGDDFINVALSGDTVTELSKQLFGGKVTGKSFRKSFSTWVDNQYGSTSDQFQLVDYFGLTHRDVNKKIYQSYQSKFSSTGDGMPTGKYLDMFKSLQKEYQDLIFNSVTSEQMKKMKNAQLKKYGLTEGNLDLAGAVSIYRLKKGFENIALISKAADKDGFISIEPTNVKGRKADVYKIHENVLEATFRTMSEGSSRIIEQFGNIETQNILGIPISKKFAPLEELLQKAGVIQYATQLEAKNQEFSFTKKQIDVFRESSLERNAIDNKKSLRAKAKILLAGNMNKEVTRKNLGNKAYESKLKDVLLKSKILTKDEINSMKSISLQDDIIDESVLQRLIKHTNCN
tara:strand:- start:7891 stop:11424 length:3534 start_codon:yes stop_codon:yes gene_type:complete